MQLQKQNRSRLYEFIFINDGSTDSTGTIIDNFVRNDKRAIGITQSNKGVSAARNA
ncbi:MAG: glycosyltransferase, partial [Peptococcaceae bacterium]|nr:glycosyltransferase [Peptococcaceae bacterium]